MTQQVCYTSSARSTEIERLEYLTRQLQAMAEEKRQTDIRNAEFERRKRSAQIRASSCIEALSAASLIVSDAAQKGIIKIFLFSEDLTANRVQNDLRRLHASRAVSSGEISGSESEELEYFYLSIETDMNSGGGDSNPGSNDPNPEDNRLSMYLKLFAFLTFKDIKLLRLRKSESISGMIDLLSWLKVHSLLTEEMKGSIVSAHFMFGDSTDAARNILGMLRKIHALNLSHDTFKTITLRFFSDKFDDIFPILIELLPEMPILRTLLSDDEAEKTHPHWHHMLYHALQRSTPKFSSQKKAFFEQAIAVLRKCVQLQVDPPTHILEHPKPLECLHALASVAGLSLQVDNISSFLELSPCPLALLNTFQLFPDSMAYGHELSLSHHPCEAMEAFCYLSANWPNPVPPPTELLTRLDTPYALDIATLYLEVCDGVSLSDLILPPSEVLQDLNAILACLKEHQLVGPDFKTLLIRLLCGAWRQYDFALPALQQHLMTLSHCNRLDNVTSMILFNLPSDQRAYYASRVQLISDEAWHLREAPCAVDLLLYQEKDTVFPDRVKTCIDEWCFSEKKLMPIDLLEHCVDKASFMVHWQRQDVFGASHQKMLLQMIDRYHELVRLDQIVAMVEDYYKTHQVGLPVIFHGALLSQSPCIQFKVELTTGQLSFTPAILVPEFLSEAVKRISCSVLTDEIRAQLEKRLRSELLEQLAAGSSGDMSNVAKKIIQFNLQLRQYLELHGEDAVEKMKAHINKLEKEIKDCEKKSTDTLKEWQAAYRQAFATAKSTYQAPNNPPWLHSHYPLAQYCHPCRKPYLLASIVGVMILITSICVPVMGLTSLIISGLLCAVVPVMLAVCWVVDKWIDPKTKNDIEQVELDKAQTLKNRALASDTLKPLKETYGELKQSLFKLKNDNQVALDACRTLEMARETLKIQWMSLLPFSLHSIKHVQSPDICQDSFFKQMERDKAYEANVALMLSDPMAWQKKHFSSDFFRKPMERDKAYEACSQDTKCEENLVGHP